MDKAVFYREWLGLDKYYFKLLTHLTIAGEFQGNPSDLCRFTDVSVQDKNRKKLKAAVDVLAAMGYIEASKEKSIYTLHIIPKAEKVEIPAEWVQRIMSHEYPQKISPQAVLKVLIWYNGKGDEVVQNKEVANDIAMSEDTVSLAKKVLDEHFEVIMRQNITIQRPDGSIRTMGHNVQISAWMNG